MHIRFPWRFLPEFGRTFKASPKSILAGPIVLVLILSLIWIVLLWHLSAEKEKSYQAALQQVSAIARAHSKHIGRTIEAVDQTLQHVRFEWEMSNGALALEHTANVLSFPKTIAFVSIVGREGKVITSNVASLGELDLSVWPFFERQRTLKADHLDINPPIEGRASKRVVIPFSRPIRARDGTFNGMVVASIIPGYFTANYDMASLGAHGLLGMVGSDHRVRALQLGAQPELTELETFRKLPTMLATTGLEVLAGTEWFADGRTRFVAWQPVEDYPVSAIAGLDEETAFAAYRHYRSSVLNTASWFTAALVLAGLVCISLWTMILVAKRRVAGIQAAYRVATEEGNEGFFIVQPVNTTLERPRFVIMDCNLGGAALLGRQRNDLIGLGLDDLLSAREVDRLGRRFIRAIRTGIFEGNVHFKSPSTGNMQWLYLRVVFTDGWLGVTVQDVTELKQTAIELERRTTEDYLTGLPNRYWAQIFLPLAIERAMETQQSLAVMFLDLDGFKAINDTLGHAAGDELLKHVAARLKVTIRPNDYVVRLGGDEFVVIVEKLESVVDVDPIAHRIRTAFADPFHLQQGVYRLGVSIGISGYPRDGSDAATLLKNADIAMYSAKHTSRGGWRHYEARLYEELRARVDKEAELRRAIELDQLTIYYQPRVDMATGKTSSMEALVRWSHPDRGIIGPNEFITLAEETGLIITLGEIVIEKVFSQISTWIHKGVNVVPVSINVSPQQFSEVDVAGVLGRCLARYGVYAELIEIEITESAMVGDTDLVGSKVASIQRMGIKVCIDDFGTGYSSLSQLQRLDFDVLKVDRAFTSRIETTDQGEVFFRAIVTMAHALGMRVVAEGVENLQQVGLLRALRCDEIQGYYVSAPMPAVEAERCLSRTWLSEPP